MPEKLYFCIIRSQLTKSAEKLKLKPRYLLEFRDMAVFSEVTEGAFFYENVLQEFEKAEGNKIFGVGHMDGVVFNVDRFITEKEYTNG